MASYTVYAITDNSGLVKIGIAKSMSQRLQHYKTHNAVAELAFTMELEGANRADAQIVERMVFFILSGQRRDGEWFECSVKAVKCAIRTAANAWAVLVRTEVLFLESGESPNDLICKDGEASQWYDAKVRHVREDLEHARRTYEPFTAEIAKREKQVELLRDYPDDRPLREAMDFDGVPNARCLDCGYLYHMNERYQPHCGNCGSGNRKDL